MQSNQRRDFGENLKANERFVANPNSKGVEQPKMPPGFKGGAPIIPMPSERK